MFNLNEKAILFVFFLALLLPQISFARSAPYCEPSKEFMNKFIDEAVKNSDLIIFAKIKDYSNANLPMLNSWTKVKILDVLYTKASEKKGDTIKFNAWQAANEIGANDLEKGSTVGKKILIGLVKQNNSYFFSALWDKTPPEMSTRDDFLRELSVYSYDLAIEAEIMDYSNVDTRPLKEWTKIEILDVIHTKNSEKNGDVITIDNWQADGEPLFFHTVGKKIILLIKKQSNGYELINIRHDSCFPSIIDFNPERAKPITYYEFKKEYLRR